MFGIKTLKAENAELKKEIIALKDRLSSQAQELIKLNQMNLTLLKEQEDAVKVADQPAPEPVEPQEQFEGASELKARIKMTLERFQNRGYKNKKGPIQHDVGFRKLKAYAEQ